MTDRIERHRQMAEAGINEHRALTAANVAGRRPVIARASTTGVPATYFTPQGGEQLRADGISWGGSEKTLKELQIFWKRIPDFGIEARIYPSETGWAQALNWIGTADDGTHWDVQEVDIFTTDEAFNVIRMEIYSDLRQWKDLLTFLGCGDMTGAAYYELIQSQPGSGAGGPDTDGG
ncbi:MAG: hypothetical protein EOP61_32350 [Sphingomonadales bacterium]|nr:MAG: hypothetical protein EOP61_32350 [Sphingomonadales bacterium]